MLGVRLVGKFAVTRDADVVDRAEIGSRKSRELLKLLAVERRHAVSVERIVDVLWPEDAPAQPAASVATLVSRLRRSLGAEVIDGDRDGYQLGRPPAVAVDLDDAARWADEAGRRLADAEPALAAAAATRAVDLLCADEVLADEPAAEWVESARSECAELLARARRVLADAALGTRDHAVAASAAAAAIAADPYDERAVRALMRAHLAAGEPGRALTAYAELQELLAAELGADPAAETQALHLAALRDEPPDALPVMSTPAVERSPASDSLGLVGRAEQLRELRTAWNAAAAGKPAVVLVVGEAGIGKTRLVDELSRIAASTGGRVLAARCYATERSLFLQPFVEAIAEAVRTLPPSQLLDIVGDHAPGLSRLIPAAAAVLGPAPRHLDSPDIERRRAFEAATATIRGLADRTPVLIVLDDLQNAGQSTIELLHYLSRHASTSRLLVVATIRVEEGDAVLGSLSAVAGRLDLGPLPREAVARLAAAAGLADQTDALLSRTHGHALFVVESLRALAAGDTGVPESLEAAVLDRVRRSGHDVGELLRAGAVLGVSFDTATVAGLLGRPLNQGLSICEAALSARLLTVAGRDWEFANDLVRDVLYMTTPAPVRDSYHRRAADLLTAHPEAVATHAAAVEDWSRAARAWLLAGEEALARAAAADAVELLTRALAAAEQVRDREVQARARMARSHGLGAQADFAAALVDIEVAVDLAREVGDQRLEVIALRALGGDAAAASGRPISGCLVHLERGLRLAAGMSDRAMEADLQAWMAVLAANDLRFADSVEHGRLAVEVARISGDDEALAAALDGQKTSLAYIGEIAPLEAVLTELEPLLRRQGDLFRLHWAVFESSFIAVAAGEWAAAAARIEQALDIHRRGGLSAYAPWHLAHLGWLARLTGDYDRALDIGTDALDRSREAPHVWCIAAAGAILGATLLEVGDRDRAVGVLETARAAARQDGANAYLLRALAPLAEATGSRSTLVEADALLGRITAPPGAAFLAGDACYLAIARSWIDQGEPQRARDALTPLLTAAERVPWVAALADASLVDGRAALLLGRTETADARLRRALELGDRYGLPRIARAATQELALVGG